MYDLIPEARERSTDTLSNIPRMIPEANPVSSRAVARMPAADELIKASLEGDRMRVQILLELGVSPNGRERLLGSTALMIACLAGQVEIARDLLDHGADLELRDNDGRTALMEACMAGHKDSVLMLVEKGANVHAESRHGTTPLLAASVSGQPEVVRIILERGADVNAANRYGKTPLAEATASGCAETVKVLLSWGAHANAVDATESGSLCFAPRSGT